MSDSINDQDFEEKLEKRSLNSVDAVAVSFALSSLYLTPPMVLNQAGNGEL